MNHFNVAAGILCDSDGRILIAERLGGGPFHGLWEFPGGKIGADESSVQALSRELAEELGIEITTCAPFMNLRHEYDDRIVTIEFFIVSDWTGTAILLAAKDRPSAGCRESGWTLRSYCRPMFRSSMRLNSSIDAGMRAGSLPQKVIQQIDS
jgi:8-oxo-dGTP diphosphatase